MNFVPSRRGGYVHCCVFPLDGQRAWPASLADALLVGYDLGGVAALPAGWRTPDEQRTPADVVANLRRIGVAVDVNADDLPRMDAGLFAPAGRRYVRQLSAVVPSPDGPPAAAWHEASRALRASPVPSSWDALSGCAAVLHFADDEYAYLLSPDEARVRAWIAGIVRADLLPPDADTRAADSVARWIVERFDGGGGRITSASTEDGGRTVHLRGAWGRTPGAPLRLGAAGGDPFSVALRVE